MNRPRLYVDFNELIEDDLVLLSQSDTKTDSSGDEVALYEGLLVYVYMDDTDAAGETDNLLADGLVERNVYGGWTAVAKWCCRIDENGIENESDRRLREADERLSD